MSIKDKNPFPSEEAYQRVARKEAEKRYAEKKAEREKQAFSYQTKQRILNNPLIQILAKNIDLKKEITQKVIAGSMAGIFVVSGLGLIKKTIDEYGPTIIKNDGTKVKVSEYDKEEEKTNLERAAELAIINDNAYKTGHPVTEEMVQEFTDTLNQAKEENALSPTGYNEKNPGRDLYFAMETAEKAQQMSQTDLKQEASDHKGELRGAIAEEVLEHRPFK